MELFLGESTHLLRDDGEKRHSSEDVTSKGQKKTYEKIVSPESSHENNFPFCTLSKFIEYFD